MKRRNHTHQRLLAVLCCALLMAASIYVPVKGSALVEPEPEATTSEAAYTETNREEAQETASDTTTENEATADTTTEKEAAAVATTEAAADTTTETATKETSTETASTLEETEEPLSTESYELDSTPIPVPVSELVFQDGYDNPIDISQPLQYTYQAGSQQSPNLYIYYNNTQVSFYNFTHTTQRLNPATGLYEPYSGTTDETPAGTYSMTLTPDNSRGFTFSIYDYTTYSYTYYIINESITIYYVVNPKNLADADIICSSIKDQTYEGEALFPYFEVSYGYNTLTPNIGYETDYVFNPETYEYDEVLIPYYNTTYDYTVEYLNNTAAGQGIIRITGVGNYTGTRDILFNIFVHVSTLNYSGYQDTVYSGQSVTFPGFTAMENTKVLTQGTDYTITYSDNVNYGEATITVQGMGFYTGTFDLHFGIVPKKVTGISISSPKSLQAKITWKKCKGADGFEISRYNTKKKRYEVIAFLGDGRWQVYQDAYNKLKNNVTYRYQIRPYVLSSDNKTKYFGPAAYKKGKVTKKFKELNVPIYTGSMDVDYAAEVICKKVIKKGMSQQQKVKAIYDWVVEHCEHDKDYGEHKILYSYKKNKKKAAAYDKKIWKKIFTGKADCNFDGFYHNCSYNKNRDDDYYYYSSDENDTLNKGFVDGHYQFDRTYEAFQTHKGGCSYITRLFKALINHAGLECNLVDGNFVNRDGTRMYHYWTYIRVNKKCAWYDVDIATSHKNMRYIWYKKNAKFWHTCHEWDPKDEAIPIPSYLN